MRTTLRSTKVRKPGRGDFDPVTAGRQIGRVVFTGAGGGDVFEGIGGLIGDGNGGVGNRRSGGIGDYSRDVAALGLSEGANSCEKSDANKAMQASSSLRGPS